MFQVYILYSPSIDRFYIGQTADFQQRYAQHHEKYFAQNFTAQCDDWQTFLTIECSSRSQAVNIERHIKAMKSKKYIYDLERFPEMVTKIKIKYN